MHIQRVIAKDFKCFKDLEITLAAQPRLVVLSGENGSGKSSVIDALASWRLRQRWGVSDPAFFARGGTDSMAPAVQLHVEFHEAPDDARSAIYVRTAQRVTVEFQGGGLQAMTPSVDTPGPHRSIDIDDRVTEDYQRLVAESLETLWDADQRQRQAGEIIDSLVGAIDRPLGRLLPGLTFDGPDYPLAHGSTFRFSKGESRGYAYKNLSGGEKAVFDLLLDAAVKRRTFGAAVWAIDEPELHVNARIHALLLREMLALLPEAQLWIATHSPGMLAEARRLQDADPGSVAFLDLSDRDPGLPIVLEPLAPDRAFWKKQLTVALGDLAQLVAPSRVVLCEGSPDGRDRPRASWDARVLEKIFGDSHPDTAFVSVGNADDVIGDRMDIGRTMETLVDGVEILRIIDRDGRSRQEIEDLTHAGCRVLGRRHLEGYLLDDEVLDALCDANDEPDKKGGVRQAVATALASSVQRGNPPDDLKSAANEAVSAIRRLLVLTRGGNTSATFLRDSLAPLVRPGMAVFEELRTDVFGGEPAPRG